MACLRPLTFHVGVRKTAPELEVVPVTYVVLGPALLRLSAMPRHRRSTNKRKPIRSPHSVDTVECRLFAGCPKA